MSGGTFLNNGLYASIDWIEFTIHDVSLSGVFDILGFDITTFKELEKGGLGYLSCMRHAVEDVCIFYNGNENMGIHIRIKGSAVNFALTSFLNTYVTSTPFGDAYNISFEDSVENLVANSLPLYCKKICECGSFSRLDLAIDDYGCQYFSTRDVVSLLESGAFTSRFRKWQNVCSYEVTGEITGHTVYLGSRTSDVMLRVYDKRLEKHVDFPWIRWELELKNEKATSAAESLAALENIGAVCVGVLSHYVRFINRDNDNVSRCSVNPIWQQFIDNISPLLLTIPKHEQSVEQKTDWFSRQVLPTFYGLLLAYNGDTSFLGDANAQLSRLNRDTLQMFENYANQGVEG